jgi:hypothetical protein
MLGLLERPDLNRWRCALSNGPNRVGVSPPPLLRMVTNSVSVTLCSLEYRTMGKVQKPSNPNEGLICYKNH